MIFITTSQLRWFSRPIRRPPSCLPLEIFNSRPTTSWRDYRLYTPGRNPKYTQDDLFFTLTGRCEVMWINYFIHITGYTEKKTKKNR